MLQRDSYKFIHYFLQQAAYHQFVFGNFVINKILTYVHKYSELFLILTTYSKVQTLEMWVQNNQTDDHTPFIEEITH